MTGVAFATERICIYAIYVTSDGRRDTESRLEGTTP
jgi:hypothetical protein